ncbi:MAG: CAP domain-containing protein, partial [Anaerolineae bacterium]
MRRTRHLIATMVLLLMPLTACSNGPSTEAASSETPGAPAAQASAAANEVTPPSSEPPAMVRSDAVDPGGEAPAPEITVAPTPGPEARETSSPPATPVSYTTVTIQEGDTLLGLAMDHGVPMAAIQLQNDLGSSTVVRLGQQIVIPPSSAWESASPFWIVHVVEEGETLSEIAQLYGLTLTELQGANGLADADLLGVGQALVLPVTDFVAARPVASQPTSPPPAPTDAQPSDDGTSAASDAAAADPLTATPPAPSPAIAPPPNDVSAWPYETVRIMNEVRAAHGLPPLAYNETLARTAQAQANDCATRGSCSHTGSDGSTIKERILRVGYKPASWAECWAIRPTPREAIDIWMDEVPPNDPHRRTLLTTWLTEVGIGVAKAHWGYYFIADFGKPL